MEGCTIRTLVSLVGEVNRRKERISVLFLYPYTLRSVK